MVRKFRDAFVDAVKMPGWSITLVSELSGVSLEQLKKLNQGKTKATNVDDAVKVANAFGVTLDEFLQDNTAALRTEAASLWQKLSQEEREILLAAARGRAAQSQEQSQ